MIGSKQDGVKWLQQCSGRHPRDSNVLFFCQGGCNRRYGAALCYPDAGTAMHGKRGTTTSAPLGRCTQMDETGANVLRLLPASLNWQMRKWQLANGSERQVPELVSRVCSHCSLALHAIINRLPSLFLSLGSAMLTEQRHSSSTVHVLLRNSYADTCTAKIMMSPPRRR